MSKLLRLPDAMWCLALLMFGASGALAAPTDASQGKALLEKNCGRCHSLEATGTSPLPQAPPLREVYLKYPIDQLEEGFAEGMGSRHRDMPQSNSPRIRSPPSSIISVASPASTHRAGSG